ncbi:MAG TPA: DUF3800 domain-containing protein [Sedimentisphaerales bacterium]|jgi:hypothetical protein|nr:DUF3800 domain-containing protein [Sedimentisphaerales bacterium]HNU27907.1 DUF3800 domain-containing protein [Sedimentisphaerales bacterium]
MYICYGDESGHCGKKLNPKQPVQVMCGVLNDLTKLSKTQREHAEILSILNGYGIPLAELKGSEAYRGRGAWEKVPADRRDRLYESILGWAAERACKFIVCPIDSVAFFGAKDRGCADSERFRFPYEASAMNILLALQRYQQPKRNNKGRTIVIFDEQPGHDTHLLELSSGDLAFTDSYTGYDAESKSKSKPDRFDQIVDVPHFSKSHLAVLIQIADWAAFVVNRYLLLTVYEQAETYPGELVKIEAWHKQVREALVLHTAIDPPGQDGLPAYFRSMRPSGWTARKWTV